LRWLIEIVAQARTIAVSESNTVHKADPQDMKTWPTWQSKVACAAMIAAFALLGGCGDQSPKSAKQEPNATTTVTAVSPVQTSDGKKVVRLEFPVQESGFDPVTAPDLYSGIVVDGIFDTILTYDYLAEPAKIVPKISTEMPTVEDGGKLYTIKLKKGVFFSPHEVFGGKKRELVAQDVVYSFKRHFDDSLKPVWRFLIDGKIVGMNEWYDAGKKAGKLDWDAPIPGMQIVDSHTIKIQLTRPDYNFNFVLAHVAMGIVAREVVEKYPNDVQSHPVGSSAYYLKEWTRGQKIVLERNPNWRGGTWDFKPSGKDPHDELIVKQMQGKPLAVIDRVEIYPIEEEQSNWLTFSNAQLDVYRMPGGVSELGMKDGKILPSLAAKGIRLQRFIEPEYTYTYFNWTDPVWGGAEPHKVALRRAVVLAVDRDEEVKLLRKGQAVRAEFLVPPGVVGNKPDFSSNHQYNPALANALLDKYGYKKGSDGWRRTPDGKTLEWKYTSIPIERERQFDEFYKRYLDVIGIKFVSEKEKFADSIKREKRCQIQSRGAAWIADYPDGDNFIQLLYSKNIGESNNGCYKSEAFDKLYEQSARLPDGPERDKLYLEMQRQFEADTPWMMGVSRYRNQLIQPWVIGYKKHPILLAEWMYFDVNMAKGK
jgi:oligopeptide transport system substrate-binding protein